jgi:hypothetical protein
MKKKPDVFDGFHNFVSLVERKFDNITMQTDWAENMRN